MSRLKFDVPGWFGGAAIFATLFALLGAAPAGAQTPDASASASSQSNSADRFQLNVKSNLVVVRVVVHDAQGNPVEGLQKQDFKLLDRGKEQNIVQFDAAAPSVAGSVAPATVVGQAPAPAERFLVLYFDDLDMSEVDVMDARDAADHYLAANLAPSERVAIFTSAAMLSDFTVNPKQLHDALFRLRSRSHTAPHSECPELSDYQAQEISDHDNPNTSDAWKVAIDEAENRHCMPNPKEPPPNCDKNCFETLEDNMESQIRNLARMTQDRAEMQARTSLQGLDQIVRIMSRAPGQRNIILVSPGFLSQSEQYQLDGIVDRALRSQTVISSLDPRGLAILMREADVTSSYAPAAGSGVVGAQHTVDAEQQIVSTDVLAELAEGTGGNFFRNNNDLAAGFNDSAGVRGSYVLAFSPSDIKQDGSFHSLKVTLAEKHPGLHVQSRRGYYDAKPGQATQAANTNAPSAPAQPDPQPPAIPAVAANLSDPERIRAALLAKTTIQELPVEMRTEVAKASDNSELNILIHLDAKSLRFHKQDGKSQSLVTFVSVITDQNGKYITSQQRQARVDLADDVLPNFLASGMDVKTSFPLKPGSYIVREAVSESEEHHITTIFRRVDVQ